MIELNLRDTPGEISHRMEGELSHRMESTHSNYSDHYDSHRVMKPKIQLTEQRRFEAPKQGTLTTKRQKEITVGSVAGSVYDNI